MKKILIPLVFALLVACSQENPSTIRISGIIENPTAATLEIFYFKDFIQNNRETAEATLDENNSFSIELPVSKAEFVYVSMPRRNLMLYVLPGADIQLVLDAADASKVAEVKGNLAYEGKYLADYAVNIERQYNPQALMGQIGNMEPDQFMDFMHQVEDERIEHLQNFEFFSFMDPRFLELQKAGFCYEKHSMMLNYPLLYARSNQGKQPELPEYYYDFLQDEGLMNDDHIVLRQYTSFLNGYQNHKLRTSSVVEGDPRSFSERQYDLVREMAQGKTHDFMLSQVMNSLLNFGSMEVAQPKYEDYQRVVHTPEYKKLVEEEYLKIMALAPGQKAPDFSLTDLNGDVVSLGDFAGKVVYLDFWASWCGPCMAEVPHFAELKKRMADQDDLVYLYISVDTDQEAWRNTVAKHDIKGVHLNVPGFGHEVTNQYNLKGVPTFYLIGRDGNIIDNRPPRPSNPRIDEVLLNALAMEL